MAFFDYLNSQRAVAIVAGDVPPKSGATKAQTDAQWHAAFQMVYHNTDPLLRAINQHMLQQRKAKQLGKPIAPWPVERSSLEDMRMYHVEGWLVAAEPLSWWQQPFFSPQLVLLP